MSTIKSEPTIFIIFGGTGDLNARKLAPALYNLFLDGYLPKQFSIIGTGRTKLTDEQFRKNLNEDINNFSRSGKTEKDKWAEFEKNIFYQVSDAKDAETYKEFGKRIEAHNAEWKTRANVIYYLAVSPSFFPIITSNLAKAKLTTDVEKTRIVIEKPFGHDLESARELNKLLAGLFNEKQIYHIDHYLGKETVQNIMAFRFANSILEPIWNRNYIEHVQISVTEQLGVEDRGDYYDGSGAMRDMIQNHLLQLLCLVAMETPVSFNADEIRNRKVDVLHAMRRFSPEDVRMSAVRGQYAKGWMEGKEVPGYREEPKVDPNSNTETFAAIKFFVDNWRWQGVPFYVRTGKRLHQSSSVISIQFKDVPHKIFPTEAAESWQQNRLIISIQPEMSIRLQVQAKRPGLDMILNTVDMVFDYKGTYTNQAPEAYETLLLDTMLGDQTLFMRGDQIEAAWDLIMPILSTWTNKKSLNFPNYSADAWGPESAEALIARDGFNWFSLPLKNTKK
ncbi:glucose-6-phosphate dehydrogenase [Mucilaginibacter sp. UR6-11]|uniref:glucose-6-phosphate dehydrogenase n=1 Tax=Mucilaginibacter sp. UR6-11 TaxID=1435644 RepID=UPI001E4628E0|nr:glucose-6-phosphate dehydrogenase [Mucilaginibacter sp. UR6-11]MCC8426769.1 glucose-6-phosphate dehydrogenase [Mucilaginibacter sp. UR6-11]